MARNINNQLEDTGFKNLGVDERKNLVVLKRTKMPAVLVEAGFINNDKDNYLFDEEFDSIAQAIADGILESIHQAGPEIPLPIKAIALTTIIIATTTVTTIIAATAK